jgi:tetratricopeptide (TPR) repeat protein
MRNAALLLALTLPMIAQQAPSVHRKVTFSTNRIRGVLLLARESALKEERDEDGMQGGSLPEHLQMMMAGFRSIDDWEDAVILRDHVNEDHRVDVICAPPHATRADYESLRKSVQTLVENRRDEGLQRLINQELSDGFVDEAEETATGFLDSRVRSDAYAEIAVSCWKAGEREKASRLFQTAVDAALKMKPMYGEVDQTAERIPGQLGSIAEQRYRTGDQAGALEFLSQAKVMAEDVVGFRDSALTGIANTQTDLGLLNDARATAAEIENEVFRSGVLDGIREQEMLESPASATIRLVLDLVDAGAFKARELVAVASKQGDRGDTRGATETLDRAFDVVQESDPANVPHPANARDVGLSYRLIAIGYSDVGANQKAAVVLHQLASIKEASSLVLDRYAYLFDLAVGYAALGGFNRAHGFVNEMGKYPNEQACETVSYEDVRHGHVRVAVRWAKAMKDSGARTSALVGIVSAMLDMNEEAGKVTTRQGTSEDTANRR